MIMRSVQGVDDVNVASVNGDYGGSNMAI